MVHGIPQFTPSIAFRSFFVDHEAKISVAKSFETITKKRARTRAPACSGSVDFSPAANRPRRRDPNTSPDHSIAVSQAPSPESNPNSPSPVTTMFHCTGRAYLDMHGLIFETSICYWQDQPAIIRDPVHQESAQLEQRRAARTTVQCTSTEPAYKNNPMTTYALPRTRNNNPDERTWPHEQVKTPKRDCARNAGREGS
ncbi:hypothetical protein SADUNF_Sadunf19G0060000 [Salix dunnii]|uniref:Uncharacterized protein n=1 Tax=Salix dunnii TaxID=1413687 RepID=A0A835ML28_9ROSI|nr:hypothetical protein SADUNF_Sadunf19G0060000 [Salix dunnii]